MPPAVDVYVWLAERRPEDLARFIEDYVDSASDALDGHRLPAFRRVYLEGSGTDADHRLLAEMHTSDGGGAFSLYLRGRDYYHAMITITREGAAVLGLSIDDPYQAPETLVAARKLMDRLRVEFGSPAGLAGTELPPPQSRADWSEDYGVQIRVGSLPAAGDRLP